MDITPAWGKETWEDYTRQFLPSAFYCLSRNITDFQGFVGFRWSQKWFSYSSTHTHYFQLQFLETLSSKLSIISCNTESGCVGDLVYLYMCVYTSFSHSEFTFSSHLSSSIRLSMSSKVWVYFSAVNCYIKSTSKCYHMTLAFLRHTCFPSFLPFMLLTNVFWLCFFMAKFTLSLWSRSSLSIHWSVDILPLSHLDFCQYRVMWGMLGCLCLLQQRFPLQRGPGMGVPDDMDALFFIVSRGTTAHLSR